MPFKSKRQSRFLFSQKPTIAKEFLDKSKSKHPIKNLPEKVKKKKT